MRLFSKLKSYKPDPKSPLILGLGNFDGLHLGHQALLARVVETAKARKGRSAVFTFREHPQAILHPESKPPLLTSPAHKLFFFHELGIQECFLIPFTKEFSKLEPETFVKDILVNQLKVSAVFLGFNARFGKGRKGDGSLMRELAKKCGFHFEEIKPVKAAGDFVSSSRIRQLIQDGKLDEAGTCLGRPFRVFGKVIKGDGRGHAIGFPTANLETDGEVLPPEGVYAVSARFLSIKTGKDCEEVKVEKENQWRPSVVNFGRRPTFHSKKALPVLEVHIMDFDQDIYGKTMEIVFQARLRGEMAFQGSEALKQQIAKDIASARKIKSLQLK